MKKAKQLPYPVIALRCYDWAGTDQQMSVSEPIELMDAWIVGMCIRETPKLYEVTQQIFDAEPGCEVQKRHGITISKSSVVKKIVLSPGGAKKGGKK